MQREMVIRQVDKTPKVPLVVGSGCQATVSFVLLFPKMLNILLVLPGGWTQKMFLTTNVTRF